MNNFLQNLINKKISAENGARYLLCALGIFLIILNPFLVSNSLVKIKDILIKELEEKAVSIDNPINFVRQITDISVLKLKTPHYIKINNKEDGTSMSYFTLWDKKAEEVLEDLNMDIKNDYIIVPSEDVVLNKSTNNIYLYKKKSINIIDHDQEFVIDTYFTTVVEVIDNLGVKLTENQRKKIDLDAPIIEGMTIEIFRDVIQRGYASWYGPGFHGRTTANGEKYDMYELTAAHKTLPFNSKVRVINKYNSRSCVVRINDRGPYIQGRIIDLSYTAKQLLGIDGIARVDLEIVE